MPEPFLKTPVFLLALFLTLLAGCSRQPALVQQESYVFGTRVEILVAEPQKEEAEKAAAAVLREFDRMHQVYHAWQPSELMEVNKAFAVGKSIRVNPEMRQYLAEAMELSKKSAYRFDPGIGRLIEIWGFHSDEFAPKLPDPKALADWRKNPASIAQLELKQDIASSQNPALALDFGGYLKGVALDKAAEILKAHNIHNALINIGGNIMALGNKYGQPWKVGIQHPREPGPMATLELLDGEAIGTSGDYQRYFELGGKRYSHLLDPQTAAPVTHTQAVTVLISPQEQAGMLSDVLSKPIFIAGENHWQEIAQKIGASQVLRVGASGGIQMTKAMKARLRFIGKPVPEKTP